MCFSDVMSMLRHKNLENFICHNHEITFYVILFNALFSCDHFYCVDNHFTSFVVVVLLLLTMVYNEFYYYYYYYDDIQPITLITDQSPTGLLLDIKVTGMF